MQSIRGRPLFLKWLLLNSLAVVFLTVLATYFHGSLRGAPLIVVPVIVAIAAYASFLGGRLCWRTDSFLASEDTIEEILRARRRILHEARYLEFWAWVCQMTGILSTVIGFFILLSHSTDTASLGARIQSGGGTALLGTFVGVFASLVLSLEHRLIEHELGE